MVSCGPDIPGVRRNGYGSNATIGGLEYARSAAAGGQHQHGGPNPPGQPFRCPRGAIHGAGQAAHGYGKLRRESEPPDSGVGDLPRASGQAQQGIGDHARLATGAASTAPPDSAGFEMGAGASWPTDEDLAALVARAQTSAEHRALEEYFAALEKQYASDAVKQKTRASAYRGLPRSPGWAAAAAVHFDQLASRARAAAQGAKEAAATQGRLAGTSR